ncbi:uncharacterized protein LOC134661135 [Cydia amplana]|uniref:uncharacterized protein LOC134661135 n=1 Tax=Cydia amplana TaxID=1869771 RepID=UPI002FE5C627
MSVNGDREPETAPGVSHPSMESMTTGERHISGAGDQFQFLPSQGDLITLSGYPDAGHNSTDTSAQRLPTALNLPPVNQTMLMDNRINHTYTKQPDLTKCKINYNGRTCVREFLTQVEELQYARRIDEAYLVRAFPCLLSDSALKWFRTVRHRVTTWYELKLALLRRFDKNDFDYQLEYQLRTRKQRPKESLSDFIIDLMDMNGQLTFPLTETVLLGIFRHNMLPSLMVHFVGKTTYDMDVIVRLSKEIDAYTMTVPSQHQSTSNSNLDKPTRKYNPIDVVKPLTCLKCEKNGHHYRDCKTIRGTICFKCKKRDVTTLTCDICKSGTTEPTKVASPKNE